MNFIEYTAYIGRYYTSNFFEYKFEWVKLEE